MSNNFQQALEAWAQDHLDDGETMPQNPRFLFEYDAPYRYSEYTAGGGDFWLRMYNDVDSYYKSWWINTTDYGNFFNSLLSY